MKFTAPVSLACLAGSGMIPAASALLGTSCLSAVNAAAKLPGLVLENLQRQTCSAGCQPTVETWQHAIKEQVVAELVEDGANYCGINDPRTKEAFTTFVEHVMAGTAEQCKGKLENKHLCHGPDAVQPFIDCVNGKSKQAVLGSLQGLLPFANEAHCKKAAEYFTGEQLWQKDFPEHIKEYVAVCHEL